jgi:hypothetical protein
MSERFEYIEEPKMNMDTQEWEYPRNFRKIEKPGIEFEQSMGMKESEADKGQWVDTGIQDVPVEKINASDTYVNGPEDFHKVSHEKMVSGFRTLESEVRPAVEGGADKEYFRNLDRQRGLDYPNGTQRIYESFYGQDAIRLDKVGDRYLVENGYHRIFVAKELGLANIPARVIEKRI